MSRELGEASAAQARLDAITEQTSRASKILLDLLDFARRRESRREPLDVTEVVDRSVDLVAAKLAGRGIVADTDVVGPVPLVIGDRDELTQVFVNLLSNAVDAMPDGGTLRLRTEVRTADGVRCVRVTVREPVAMLNPQMRNSRRLRRDVSAGCCCREVARCASAPTTLATPPRPPRRGQRQRPPHATCERQ